MEKFKVYYLKDSDNKVVYVGFTRRELIKRYNSGYKRFDHKEFRIELAFETNNINEAYKIEEMLIEQYGIHNLLNRSLTRNGNHRKGYKHNGSFKKGQNGDERFREKRVKKIKERCCIPISCSNGKSYVSITQAATELGLQISNITKVLKGLRNHTGGYTFKYLDHDNTESQ